jgi:hypothetical protein
MRLTLRTLLAFRDRVLDPKDAAELEKRIAESATARLLSERIDAVVSNAKLGATAPDAREFGADANDVAGFLDGNLDLDDLLNLERRCLENNTLLAEVASCHQILATAVSVPVSISPGFRARIVGLHSGGAGQPNAGGNGQASQPSFNRIDPPQSIAATPHRDMTGTISESGAWRLELGLPAMETREGLQGRLQQRRVNSLMSTAGIELDDGLASEVPEYMQGTDRYPLRSILQGLVLAVLLAICASYAVGSWKNLRSQLDPSPSPQRATSASGTGMDRNANSDIVSPTSEERNP